MVEEILQMTRQLPATGEESSPLLFMAESQSSFNFTFLAKEKKN